MYDYVKPSNNAIEKRALLAKLLQYIGKTGSWPSETQLQKCVYFMQSLLNVNTGYRFVLYMHGTYSFDINEVLTWMKSRKEFDVEDYKVWELKLRLTENGEIIAREHTNFADQMQWVSSRIAPMDTTDLERVSTASLLKLGAPDWTDQRIAREINRLKPHIPVEVALQGIAEFEELRDAADADGVVLPRVEAAVS